jgi:cysteine synthase
MNKAADRLYEMWDDISLAHTVTDFASERRKNALSQYTAPLIETGRSQPQAEALARASEEYRSEIAMQEKQYQHAQAVLAKERGLDRIWKSMQSSLSYNKETVRRFEG